MGAYIDFTQQGYQGPGNYVCIRSIIGFHQQELLRVYLRVEGVDPEQTDEMMVVGKALSTAINYHRAIVVDGYPVVWGGWTSRAITSEEDYEDMINDPVGMAEYPYTTVELLGKHLAVDINDQVDWLQDEMPEDLRNALIVPDSPTPQGDNLPVFSILFEQGDDKLVHLACLKSRAMRMVTPAQNEAANHIARLMKDVVLSVAAKW